MASLAGPAGLLQGLVKGEQMQRRRRLQREERERQSERRKREETRQRLQLLLQALNNPAIRRRGAVSGGGAGGGRAAGGRDGRGRPSGAAGLPTVGRGPSEPTGQGPMTAAAPLLGLADRTRRGEAPGQENQPTGSVLSAATGGGGTRDREARGGRRVRGLGPLNELLGRSGEDALVFDPSRTEEARARRAASEQQQTERQRRATFADEIMRLAPEAGYEREELMNLTSDRLFSLLEDIRSNRQEEREREQDRRHEIRKKRLESRREERLDRARDIVFRQARQGASLDEAIQEVEAEGLGGVVDQRDAQDAFASGRQMFRQKARDTAQDLLLELGSKQAVREEIRSREDPGAIGRAILEELDAAAEDLGTGSGVVSGSVSLPE